MAAATQQQLRNDRQLVNAILSGSVQAWHQLIELYAGLILSVLRRHIFDEEDLRTAFVEVLSRLHRTKLRTYQGRSPLSIWIIIVSRTTALDMLRTRFGRSNLPTGVHRLGRLHHEVYRLYYVEGLDLDTVRHWARPGRPPLSVQRLAITLRQIEASVPHRALQRTRRGRPTSSGAMPPSWIEQLRQEVEDLSAESRQASDPEQALLGKERRNAAAAAWAGLDRLSQLDRRALKLRFGEGWKAHRIAAELGLASEQQAFTVIRRGLRQLRRLLEAADNPGMKSENEQLASHRQV